MGMDLKIQNLAKNIYSLPKKYPSGFTEEEIKNILDSHKINEKKFYKILGINSCKIIDDKVIYYMHDIELALTCMAEKRNKKINEWD